jgi:hypothetical protein
VIKPRLKIGVYAAAASVMVVFFVIRPGYSFYQTYGEYSHLRKKEKAPQSKPPGDTSLQLKLKALSQHYSFTFNPIINELCFEIPETKAEEFLASLRKDFEMNNIQITQVVVTPEERGKIYVSCK